MTERKLTRHEMREAALLILFQMKLNPETLDEILEDCKESFEMEYNSQSVKLVKGVAEHEDAERHNRKLFTFKKARQNFVHKPCYYENSPV